MEIKPGSASLFKKWFKGRGWKPFPFQVQLLEAYLNGYSGILNAPTGSGKSFAMWVPVLIESLSLPKEKKPGLKVLWITPVRALAADLNGALQSAADDLNSGWKVAARTGDTSQKDRKKHKTHPPQCLIITPESIHVLLAQKEYAILFGQLNIVVVDEWHELLGTKRGVQVELALSRLKALRPELKIWGISATIGNLEQAMEVLLGATGPSIKSILIQSDIVKKVEVEAILPDEVEKYPWAGHLGIRLLPKILPIIMGGKTTLLFTNTRSQCEIWYQRLLEAAPELAGIIALHHGSLSQEIRSWVEEALHTERLKVVVCTSSLDLGVDFRPVETIIQVGSPKGVARFLQRAGRSGHQPGAVSKIYFVPAHSLELIEAAALRTAINENKIESRVPVVRAFDVLIQYLVTLAVSDGFEEQIILKEILGTHAFNSISMDEWRHVLEFITSGGPSLQAYTEYSKVVVENGWYKVTDKRLALRHRLSIGTIVSDAMLQVKYLKGGSIGVIEEFFIARLKPGDAFSFGGRNLEMLHLRDMHVVVRNTKNKKTIVPQWMGGRMNLSSMLSDMIRHKLTEVIENTSQDIELKTLAPLFKKQQENSILPTENQFLIESFSTREGAHLFFYTFEGRYVNEGLAALVAHRLSKFKPASFSIAMTDYGFELLSDSFLPIEEALEENIFSEDHLFADIQAGLNATEMARRKFRNIAAISGLTFTGYPGKAVKNRHLQASSRLFFDVFREHEPNHLLLQQAMDEVMFDQLDEVRLRAALKRINGQEIMVVHPGKPTPFSFPILVEQFREKLSGEKLEDRVKRMITQLEK